MKYSLIITAWKEPETVSLNLNSLLNPLAGNLLDEMEILLVCPDNETFTAAKEIASKFKFPHLKWVKDEQKGKVNALNLALNYAVGEILIFTDGDVIIGKEALKPLVAEVKDSVWACTGRPVSADSKETLLGYWGNLLADAAHDVRSRAKSKGSSYHVSGYLYALKKIEGLNFPENILVDDAWISTQVIQKGYRISYSPFSLVYVKYPKNISDWFKQKRRSAGGYSQLKSLRSNSESNANAVPDRNFFEEIKYLFFPILYSKSFLQLIYSLLLYPARLALWVLILFDKLSGKHKNSNLWVRIESTK